MSCVCGVGGVGVNERRQHHVNVGQPIFPGNIKYTRENCVYMRVSPYPVASIPIT